LSAYEITWKLKNLLSNGHREGFLYVYFLAKQLFSVIINQ